MKTGLFKSSGVEKKYGFKAAKTAPVNMASVMAAAFVTLALIFCVGISAQAGWYHDQYGWRYTVDGGANYLADGWRWIDGNDDGTAECYYFDSAGYCYTNASAVTPDGYYVNSGGAWTVGGVAQTVPASWDGELGSGSAEVKDSYSLGTAGASGTGRDSSGTVSEESIYSAIMKMQSEYPEGMEWSNANRYITRYDGINYDMYGCAAFAAIVQDRVFGYGAHRDVFTSGSSYSPKAGDAIRVRATNGGEHTVVVLSHDTGGITVCEGNYSSAIIHWGRCISHDRLLETFIFAERAV